MIVSKFSIKALKKLDTIFATIDKAYGSPPTWKRDAGFNSLCRIILEQQVSIASAEAHYNKLLNYVGEITPENLVNLSAEEFRVCFISRQKASYLLALAAAVIEGSISFKALEKMTIEQAQEKLMSIKGVGKWTAEIYLIFCLQAPDILPLGDIAVYNTIKKLWGFTTKEEAEKLSCKWSPHRSLACFYLWHYYLESKPRDKRRETRD